VPIGIETQHPVLPNEWTLADTGDEEGIDRDLRTDRHSSFFRK
jgi:hypothetical protein